MPLSFRRSFKKKPGVLGIQHKRRLSSPARKAYSPKRPDEPRRQRSGSGPWLGFAILIGLSAFLLINRGLLPGLLQRAPATSTVTRVPQDFQGAMSASLETLDAPMPTAGRSTSPAAVRPTGTSGAFPSATVTPSNPWSGQIPPAACIPRDLPEKGTVTAVLDGDTIRVRLEGGEYVYSVHYLGVQAPQPGQYYGAFATGKNSELVYNKLVTLVRDITDTDDQGTLLRYVMVDDKFVNYELVTGGYAQALTSPPDTACFSTFQAAQQKAQAGKVGLWAAPSYLVPFSPTP